ncbi:hypothetical protein GCM10022219_22440 [Microbacterium oryzae]|nr:DUF559 domain-containing protein [Microbacterium oryzae]
MSTPPGPMRRLLAEVRRRHGIARVADLRDAGVGRRAMDDAVAMRLAIRPRRGWLALPQCDPVLVAAARDGVILTCLSAARLQGLWTRDVSADHVAAPSHAGHVRREAARIHWCQPLVPRAPGSLVDPIENVLAIVAECQPFEEARAIWESALHHRKVEIGAMRAFPLKPAVRRLADLVTPFADEGTESTFLQRISWMPIRIVPQVVLLGRRVDFLLGERLIVQIDGGHHVGRKRADDIAHDAQLRLHGYHVIRISYGQIFDEWPMVQDLILRSIAQGLHLAR